MPSKVSSKKVVDIGTENYEWQAENLASATQHNHQNAKSEAIVAKAKSVDSLEDQEMAIFEDSFPTYKRIRATMWRWQKEIIPKAPIQKVDLDILL